MVGTQQREPARCAGGGRWDDGESEGSNVQGNLEERLLRPVGLLHHAKQKHRIVQDEVGRIDLLAGSLVNRQQPTVQRSNGGGWYRRGDLADAVSILREHGQLLANADGDPNARSRLQVLQAAAMGRARHQATREPTVPGALEYRSEVTQR